MKQTILRPASWRLPWVSRPVWLILGLASFALRPSLGELIDLTKAQVVLPPTLTAVERQAALVLIEEVEKRTQVRWKQASGLLQDGGPFIVLGSRDALNNAGGTLAGLVPHTLPSPPEGYQLRTERGKGARTVVVCGNDPRGVMFGVGRLLRELQMAANSISLGRELRLTAAPATPLRGHQLGYRPKTNSYDAWDVPTWEQYIRDLIIFGCNAIELIPPRSDDAADSPHFPKPPLEMMIEMSRLADRYGLDVWIWYPALDSDYGNPTIVSNAEEEWAAVFRQLPRVDAVFVPGGDPGHTHPRDLLPLLERQAANLRETHPRAQMWVSPQGFTQEWMAEFVARIERDRPTWLNGIVYGPQVRVSLPELRRLIPAPYPIRHYPDITHTRQCQYPVPDWDVAFAVTEGRECINPRPMDQAMIFRATRSGTIGYITYSEGCNDDVNKAVWSALGWDPDSAIIDILRDYSRYYIGANLAEGFAQGLLALEQNWRGPLLANSGVEVTLQQFEDMAKAATTAQLRNWRFQQALFRANYDAFVRRRLLHETELELRAMEHLNQGASRGTLRVIAEAEKELDAPSVAGADTTNRLRERIVELGAALYQSIGMQLSVPRYRAIALDRGACLDTLDFPLNNRPWLKEQFRRIRQLRSEPERLQALNQIVGWENPGPGGFYDDLGNPARQSHLLPGLTGPEDPGRLQSPRSGFAGELVVEDANPGPSGIRKVAWLDHAETLYGWPLQLRYTNLDPTGRYRVRVVYAGDSPKRKIRLIANSSQEVHPLIEKPLPFQVLEFPLPVDAVATGTLTLRWEGEQGLGGNGRGCQVSEVWLVKEKELAR